MADTRQDKDQNFSHDAHDQDEQQASQNAGQPDESGMPGGGVGRREEPGHTGVYPMSAPEGASPDASLENENSWGQGERGAQGYDDSGDSESLRVPDESGEDAE